MENCIAFLTIHVPHKDKKWCVVKHEFFWLEEQKKVGITRCLVENPGLPNEVELEEAFPTHFMDIHNFAVNVDKYMGHQYKVWSDEDFVDQLVEGYIMEDVIYD